MLVSGQLKVLRMERNSGAALKEVCSVYCSSCVLHVALELQVTAEKMTTLRWCAYYTVSFYAWHCRLANDNWPGIGISARARHLATNNTCWMVEMVKDAFQSPTSTASNCSHALYVHIITVADENDQLQSISRRPDEKEG